MGFFIVFFGTEFDTYELIAGWTYDSRNRSLFATRGMRHQLFLSSTFPGSEVEYYTARYNATVYWPLWRGFLLRYNLETGMGEALQDTTALPPYKQFFGGGPGSVPG